MVAKSKEPPPSLNMAQVPSSLHIFACFYHLEFNTSGEGLFKSLSRCMRNSNRDLKDLVSLGSFICVPSLKGGSVLPNCQCKN